MKFTDIENMVGFTATKAGYLAEERAIKIETSISFFIKKKPKLLPYTLWKWLLNKLVEVKVADKWL